MPKQKSKLALAREGKVGKISIEGTIGWDWFGMSYRGFKQALKDLGDVNIIEVEINSPGGVITEGIAMVNALREHPATIHTYNVGQAASMGSVLLLAGDRAFIPDNAMTFIHKPINVTFGNAEDMRKSADELDKFEEALSKTYSAHFNGTAEDLSDLMASETWYTAEEMSDRFSNVVVLDSGEQQAAAHSDPVEVLGDVEALKESFLDRAVNKVRDKVQNNQQEVDMTPEEIKELEDSVVAKTTASVIAALKESGVIKEEEVEQPTDKVDVAFEGDQDDPEAVQAHAEKLKKAQLKAAVDWNDPESVMAYHKAIAGEEDETTTNPPTNTTTTVGKNGEMSDPKFTPEAKKAAIERMTNTK